MPYVLVTTYTSDLLCMGMLIIHVYTSRLGISGGDVGIDVSLMCAS